MQTRQNQAGKGVGKTLNALAVPLIFSFALVCSAAPARAAEEAPAESEAQEEITDNEAAEEEAASGSDGTVGGQMGEVSLEKFIPSEEISADGAVSFPVDI